MKVYRKKPVEVEAVQWDGSRDHATTIIDWIDAHGGTAKYEQPFLGQPAHIAIRTLEGEMLTSVLDFVIKGVQDEFYPCRADIFKATYDEVDEG